MLTGAVRVRVLVALLVGALAGLILAAPWVRPSSAQPPFQYFRLLDGTHNQAARVDHTGALSVSIGGGSLAISHITSVTHVSGQVQIRGQSGNIAVVNAAGALSTTATVTVDTISHITSVTHVVLTSGGGTRATFTGTSLDVNCTGCAAASVVAVSHISAAVHIGGTIQGAQFHIQGLGTPGQSHGGVLSVQGVGGGNALAVSQSGTWTVQPGNTPNTTAWIVNANQGSAGNFLWPVVAHQGGTSWTASQGPAGNALWPVAAHIQTGAVQQGAAGAQVWPVAAHQGGSWTIAHISSVTHVATNQLAPLHVTANTGSGNLTCHTIVSLHQTATAAVIGHSQAGQRLFICSVVLVASTAQNMALITGDGTGGACEGNPEGVVGGRHASIALAANGGFSSVSPFPWVATRTAGQQLCLLKSSSSGTISGVISYRAGP